ncbi:MAG TPA: MoaD/ThiS family protein [Chloroflexota bacterium]|jgi:molybdopterin synthase sulfur carrier subunit|nr:MoaD/ThiS family protein [Chloroflexota bacterium]
MAEVFLPASLMQLFPGSTKRVRVEAGTVRGVIDGLDQRWPGMRNRLCAPGPAIRQHIRIFVDSEQSTLDTPVTPTSEVQIIPALSGG